MMVDGGGVIEDGLLDCEQGHLEEGEELAHDQPDVNHADVGGGRKLLHHTETS